MNFKSILGAIVAGTMDRDTVTSHVVNAVADIEKLVADLRAEVEALKAGHALPPGVSVLHDAAQVSAEAGAVLEKVSGIAGAAGIPHADFLDLVANGLEQIGGTQKPVVEEH